MTTTQAVSVEPLTAGRSGAGGRGTAGSRATGEQLLANLEGEVSMLMDRLYVLELKALSYAGGTKG